MERRIGPRPPVIKQKKEEREEEDKRRGGNSPSLFKSSCAYASARLSVETPSSSFSFYRLCSHPLSRFLFLCFDSAFSLLSVLSRELQEPLGSFLSPSLCTHMSEALSLPKVVRARGGGGSAKRVEGGGGGERRQERREGKERKMKMSRRRCCVSVKSPDVL